MGNPMRVRATRKDGITEVKVLMSHPMETGLRKDPAGVPIPAHHITQVTAKHNDRLVLVRNGAPPCRKTRSCSSPSRAASPVTRSSSPGRTTRATAVRTKLPSRDATSQWRVSR